MHKLMVTTAGALQSPAIRLQQFDQLATLHRVYYTHQQTLKPMAASTRIAWLLLPNAGIRSPFARPPLHRNRSRASHRSPLAADDTRPLSTTRLWRFLD